MTEFTPNGRTHRILARLAESECRFFDLYQHVHCGFWTEARRKKLWRLLNVLEDRGMIETDGQSFFLLPAGALELNALDLASTTRVRVFAVAA